MWPNPQAADLVTFTEEILNEKLQEVTKSWIQREWRHTRECTEHDIPGFLCIFLLIFWKENLLHSFMVVLTISHEVMKLQSFEWLNCVSM